MKRRRWTIMVLVALVAAIAVPTLWPHGPRPSRETFEQVREGMMREEVIAVVGAPPGDYASGPYLNAPGSSWYMFCDRWVCDDTELLIAFEDNGTARFVSVQPLLIPATRPTLLERVRARFGL